MPSARQAKMVGRAVEGGQLISPEIASPSTMLLFASADHADVHMMDELGLRDALA